MHWSAVHGLYVQVLLALRAPARITSGMSADRVLEAAGPEICSLPYAAALLYFLFAVPRFMGR